MELNVKKEKIFSYGKLTRSLTISPLSPLPLLHLWCLDKFYLFKLGFKWDLFYQTKMCLFIVNRNVTTDFFSSFLYFGVFSKDPIFDVLFNRLNIIFTIQEFVFVDFIFALLFFDLLSHFLSYLDEDIFYRSFKLLWKKDKRDKPSAYCSLIHIDSFIEQIITTHSQYERLQNMKKFIANITSLPLADTSLNDIETHWLKLRTGQVLPET